jgi:DNA-binding Lrp family transcriptional regulator
MKAYVLINVRGGKTREVISKVQRIEGIKSTDACWGRPDIFAFADVPNDKALANTVLDKILTIDGVENTDTHIVID